MLSPPPALEPVDSVDSFNSARNIALGTAAMSLWFGSEGSLLGVATGHLVGEAESLLMKVHLIQAEVLLLQSVGDGWKFIGKKRAQIPFFTPNQNSYIVCVNDGADFHIPEG